jgi:hypothetical protein
MTYSFGKSLRKHPIKCWGCERDHLYKDCPHKGYSMRMQYDNPGTLEEAIRREKHIYEQSRGRPTFQKAWDDKNKGNMDQRKKSFNPPFLKNNSQSYQQGNSA